MLGLRMWLERSTLPGRRMRFLFFAIKFLPYWSIPLGLIFGEMGMIFRRRANRKLRNRMLFVSAFFFLLTVFFFVFRWDMTLYPWLRERLPLE
jgi:hypothetical protein